MFVFLCSLLIIFLGIYYYIQNVYSYWERRRIPFVKPTLPFGSFWPNILMKKSPSDVFVDIYKSTNAPVVGFYTIFEPILLIRDSKLIQQILKQDFNIFYDRPLNSNILNDPLSGNLLNMKGDKWKKMRRFLMHEFTSGKIKEQFPILLHSTKPLLELMEEKSRSQEDLIPYPVLQKYIMTVTCQTLFGTEDDHDLTIACEKFFEKSFKNVIKQLLIFFAPKMAKFLGLKFVHSETTKHIFKFTKENLLKRQNDTFHGDDLLQRFFSLWDGKITPLKKSENKFNDSEFLREISIDEIAGQIFILSLGSFESPANIIAFCLHELSENFEIQKKLQQEIDSILSQHSGEITYESINDMKYLDAVIDETLRKYSTANFLVRQCAKDYRIPDTDMVLEKGVQIIISIPAIHKDEKFYPEPDEFRPERFSGTKKPFTEMPFIPFGEGPKLCIGFKSSSVQIKIVLVSILKRFEINPSVTSDTINTTKHSTLSINTHFEGEIKLQVRKRI